MQNILESVDIFLHEAWLSVYRLCGGDELTLNVTGKVIACVVSIPS